MLFINFTIGSHGVSFYLIILIISCIRRMKNNERNDWLKCFWDRLRDSRRKRGESILFRLFRFNGTEAYDLA